MENAYSEKSFWTKVGDFCVKAGRESILVALKLYYALQAEGTPVWAKTVIVGALGYFISPVDAVPDFLPGGLVDDATVMAGALAAVAAHITPEISEETERTPGEWF